MAAIDDVQPWPWVERIEDTAYVSESYDREEPHHRRVPRRGGSSTPPPGKTLDCLLPRRAALVHRPPGLAVPHVSALSPLDRQVRLASSEFRQGKRERHGFRHRYRAVREAVPVF